jgi:hypothetical protein
MTAASTEMTTTMTDEQTIATSKPDVDALIEGIQDLKNLVLSLQGSFNYRSQAKEGIEDAPDRILLEKIVADCSQLLELACNG